RKVQNPLAEAILSGELGDGDAVQVSFDDGVGFTLSITPGVDDVQAGAMEDSTGSHGGDRKSGVA
ncbi:MAG: hypothetical protein ACJAVJ_001315, partial [Planctomycetota bacterium]